jgi:hypothetical protein
MDDEEEGEEEDCCSDLETESQVPAIVPATIISIFLFLIINGPGDWHEVEPFIRWQKI